MSPITPYLCVRDTQEALRWYAAALGAEPQGEPIMMDDGRTGHAEMTVAGARLFMADEFPEIGVAAPQPGAGSAVTLHLDVPDAAAATERAAARGASVERAPERKDYGVVAVIRDPFGHRWMLNSQ